MRPAAGAVALCLVMAGLTGCQGGSRGGPTATAPLPSVTGRTVRLERGQLGHLWPFTVDAVTARCEADDRLVITDPNGHDYGFNGKARDAGYAPVDPIRNGVSTGAAFSAAFRTCSSR